jgi:hypothetical protein
MIPVRKPLLRHTQIIRLTRLLDMLYKPAEIAAEIGVHPDTVYRSYIPAGCPTVVDSAGHFWIHGPAFVAWARQTVTQRASKRQPLTEGQAWCMRCDHPVELIAPTVRPINHYLELLQASCPICGTQVNRICPRTHPSPERSSLRGGEGGGA